MKSFLKTIINALRCWVQGELDDINTSVSKSIENIHAEAVTTKMDKENPSGVGSFSMNRLGNSDIGSYSHAEGYFAEASGDFSHAEGCRCVASGHSSHAEGYSTTASGDSSHAEGEGTTASGYYSHAEGYSTTASAYVSHAEGQGTTASGDSSHAEGVSTIASGNYSHAEGWETKATKDYSHTEGYQTRVTDTEYIPRATDKVNAGYYSHAEGYQSVAYGTVSHAEGNATRAAGHSSHAEGYSTLASGHSSHAEGSNTFATGGASHAEGGRCMASGHSSHAEGYSTTASGYYSHAEGYDTEASGIDSHAEGQGTTASGDHSHAEGFYTTAAGEYQHTQGRRNIEDANNKYAHIVGNGTSNTERSNAHTLDWEGNAWYSGDVYTGSTSGTNRDEGSKKLATEEYVDNAVGNGGGSSIQPDWNQNEPTAPDYIKNKTHHSLPDQTVDWDGNTDGLHQSGYGLFLVETNDEILKSIQLGENYFLKCNYRDEYNPINKYLFEDCIVFAFDEKENILGSNCVFAALVLKDGVNTKFGGEEVLFEHKGLYFLLDSYYMEYTESFKWDEVKQLDPKYIPDTIATKEYVDNAVGNGGGSAGGSVFTVTVEETGWDEENEMSIFSADKTFDEIYEAYQNGSLIQAYMNGLIFSLAYIDEYAIEFAFRSVDDVQCIYIDRIGEENIIVYDVLELEYTCEFGYDDYTGEYFSFNPLMFNYANVFKTVFILNTDGSQVTTRACNMLDNGFLEVYFKDKTFVVNMEDGSVTEKVENVGGSAVFTVNVTRDGDTYSADKTFDEIVEAHDSGKVVRAILPDEMFANLQAVSQEAILFEKIVGGNALSFVIYIDNTINILGSSNILFDGENSFLTTTDKTIVGAINELNAKHTEGAESIVLLSPNGTRFNITVGDDGVLTATEVEE